MRVVLPLIMVASRSQGWIGPGSCRRSFRRALLGDGLGDAQILQTVPDADDGFGFTANDAAEVFDLARERVVVRHLGDTDVERFPPRAILRSGIGLHAHRRHRQRTERAGDHVAVLVGIACVRLVLLRGLLPAARAGRRVRQHERSEGTVREAQVDRHGVLDREAARRARRKGLHRDDLTA
jgi:hypothetical protein